MSDVFRRLSQCPPAVTNEDLGMLERFVVMLYDRSSSATNVNDARFDLFARKQRAYEAIPPTQSALLQHSKRAAYQAGWVWSQSLIRCPEIPSPSDWGWVQEGESWRVYWTELEPVAKNCQELTKCGCNKDCSGNCKCYRFGLPCTALCNCVCRD